MDFSDFSLERKTRNPLLQKAQVGRCKPPSINLPPQDFFYGKAFNTVDKDAEAVKKIKITRKGELSPKKYFEVDKYTDFTKINKFGAWKGMNTK